MMSTAAARPGRNWPEYLIESLGVAVFVSAAIGLTVLLEHPRSALRARWSDPGVRRALMGVAMALTSLALVYSPFGKRSGAHFNPSVTLAFYRLGRVAPVDAACYVIAQILGALCGVALTACVLGRLPADPSVRYAITLPGEPGVAVAFIAELCLATGLMYLVLCVSNSRRWNRFTGLWAAALIALYITFEAPLSGMSMNPARSLGSAVGARVFDSLWLYFTAPPLGMLLAGELFVRSVGAARVRCAKLHHENTQRCIFRCGYASAPRSERDATPFVGSAGQKRRRGQAWNVTT